MKQFRMILPMLLSGAICGPLSAQLAPQPFIPPPTLHEMPKPGAARTLALAVGAPKQKCDPAGDVSHDGNVVTVDLKTTG